ncbi:hypothetical protein E4U13_000182 [Claviceps humidiphila]|uniref:MaoC-like domain-containing protein n=1 Tax=Claviceps humidiphila TaxID=1294629 RepID=A0A9P7Q2Z2_9HYPO|nr:hypothetical protein E4U13_000182 [Claviceps humidiphila]
MKRLFKPSLTSPCYCRRPELPTRLFSSSSSSPSPPFPHLQSTPPKLIPDHLTPMPSHLLTTTLNDLLDLPNPSSLPIVQSPPRKLPQGHHLVYFPLLTPPSRLATDGADPDHSPGVAYPRRMWAGGEVIFHRGWEESLVLDGRPWRCREDIERVDVRGEGVEEKVFVDIWRRYGLGYGLGEGEGEDGRWDIEERRTLVFMREGELEGRDGERDGGRRVIKALTFNAHSIHIDPLYTRSVERHRGLLVHGPLTLALMLRELRGTAARITYRNFAPLYVGEPLRVCVREAEEEGRPWDVWVEGPDRGMAVKGTAVMER